MTTTPPPVRQANAADADALTRILAAGFHADPPLAWIVPDAAERQRLSPAFFRPFVDLVLADGVAHMSDDLTAAALWLDVDIYAGEDPAAEDFRQLLVDGIGTDNAKRFFVLDEMFSAAHPTHESHAYLLFAGVVPERQSQGIGTAVLRTRLGELDSAGMPAYLEASSTRNARLYERLGFAAYGPAVDLPDGPALHPMWRPGAADPGTIALG